MRPVKITQVLQNRVTLQITRFLMYRFMCKPLHTEIAFLRYSTANNLILIESGYVRGGPIQLDSSWTASGPVQIYGWVGTYVQRNLISKISRNSKYNSISEISIYVQAVLHGN